MKSIPNLEQLHQSLEYNSATGVFIRKYRKGLLRSLVGNVAGYTRTNGYIQISVGGTLQFAHRLAWLWMTGEWPNGEIDHIDGNPGNNSFNNLRLVTRRQNCMNSKGRKHNKTGLKGACFHKKTGLYNGRITVDGKLISLGYFEKAEDAHQAYRLAAIKYHGEYARFE